MQKKLFLFSFIIFLSAGLFSLAPKASADWVEQMKDVPVKGDFPVGPAQISIEANPGDVIKEEVQLDNRAGEKRQFHVDKEDFEGSSTDPSATVILQGKKSGQYSAKDWLSLNMYDFSIEHGDRQYLDVTITVPKDADAGDHYASLLFTMVPKPDDTSKGTANVRITSRAGILFFITVRGPVNYNGELKSFEANKKWYYNLPGDKDKNGNYKNPVVFQTVFENDGTVRLRPGGKIVILNMLGRVSDTIPIDEYNVLRNSVRQMNFTWAGSGFRIGKYKAKIELDRGYDNLSDTLVVSFWIIPWRELLIGLVLIIVLIIILRLIYKNVHIEFGNKKKKEKRTA